MIKLSKRLESVASLVTDGYTVCDVGCDHGYTGIALAESGKCPHVIESDLRKGPLDTARENVLAAGLSDRIELRLSDGLEKLEPGETDSILISGMGGPLILGILSAYPDKTDAAKELILSPQSEIHEFEEEMIRRGFKITDKLVTKEEDKFYFVFRCVKAGGGGSAASEVRPAEVYADFLEHDLKEKNDILEKLGNEQGERSIRRREEIEKEIRRITDEINSMRKRS